MKNWLPFFLLLSLFSCQNEMQTDANLSDNSADWPSYLGGDDSNQYSTLAQINTENVSELQPAWTYRSGDADADNRSQIQCNPLVIDGILYGTSPQLKLFALDAATGKEIWRFDPFGGKYDQFGMGVNRGVTYWSDDSEQRILFTAGSFLYAVNAKSGELITTFGEEGRVDLHTGLDRVVDDLFIVSNTPGIVFEDLLILGSRVSESTGAAPGHIRAFDVKTGEQQWIFHTIPHPDEFGYETWPADAYLHSGGANAWSGLSLDAKRAMVFIPTGSASFDYYGGDRIGQNLFANCILALNARTGERIWHYQTVHHDLWDRDLPAPPNLVTVMHDGKKVDAVAQITKSAYVFLLDRETGEPLFPIEEMPVPPSEMEGDTAWTTQPIPTKPPQFSRQRLTEEELTNRTPEANAYAKKVFTETGENVPFLPLREKPTLVFPGLDGGGEWGGAAVDPDGIMYINHSEMAWVLQLEKVEVPQDKLLASRGKMLYEVACLECHGKNLEGGTKFGNSPSLMDVHTRLTATEIGGIIKNGKGAMPANAQLSAAQIEQITAFLTNSSEEVNAETKEDDFWPYPYKFGGFNRFQDPDGYPAITPPWGRISAIDLNEGEILWQSILGEYDELTAQGIPPTGTENYGGAAVTAGNLIFIAATLDEKIRAFDKRTGKQLWQADLPAAGYATPAVYAVDGKEYIVIACGGGKCGTKSGDAYVAFSLPK
ncbi:MAG: PQQ-binding-like beta-propeller repeat protein [Saprospiraceae bacterium]